MIEYTLLNVLMIELKVYYGPHKFYGRSMFRQYDKERTVLLSILEYFSYVPRHEGVSNNYKRVMQDILPR